MSVSQSSKDDKAMRDPLTRGPPKPDGPDWKTKTGLGINCLAAVLSLIEVILAAVVGHTLGICLGVLGTVLAVVSALVVHPPLSGCRTKQWRQKCPRSARVVFYIVQGLLTLWVFVLFIVRCASPSPNAMSFPSSCPDTPNCTRVTPLGNVRGVGLEPLKRQTAVSLMEEAIRAWVNSQPGARVLYEDTATGFLHARFITTVMGFADDFYTSTKCNTAVQTLEVSVQSQSRIGHGDFGANDVRVQEFIDGMMKVKLRYWCCNATALVHRTCD